MLCVHRQLCSWLSNCLCGDCTNSFSNIYQGVLGIAPRKGLQQSSAFSKKNGELLLPTAQTITALRTGMKPNELAVDLAGKARPENGTVGAFQYDMKQNRAKPLGAEDVGLLAEIEGEK